MQCPLCDGKLKGVLVHCPLNNLQPNASRLNDLKLLHHGVPLQDGLCGRSYLLRRCPSSGTACIRSSFGPCRGQSRPVSTARPRACWPPCTAASRARRWTRSGREVPSKISDCSSPTRRGRLRTRRASPPWRPAATTTTTATAKKSQKCSSSMSGTGSVLIQTKFRLFLSLDMNTLGGNSRLLCDNVFFLFFFFSNFLVFRYPAAAAGHLHEGRLL